MPSRGSSSPMAFHEEGMKAQSPATLIRTRGCSSIASRIGFLSTRWRITSSPSRTNCVGTTTGTSRSTPAATRWPKPWLATNSRHSSSPKPLSTFAMYTCLPYQVVRGHRLRQGVSVLIGRGGPAADLHLTHDGKRPDQDAGRAPQDRDVVHLEASPSHD